MRIVSDNNATTSLYTNTTSDIIPKEKIIVAGDKIAVVQEDIQANSNGAIAWQASKAKAKAGEAIVSGDPLFVDLGTANADNEGKVFKADDGANRYPVGFAITDATTDADVEFAFIQ